MPKAWTVDVSTVAVKHFWMLSWRRVLKLVEERNRSSSRNDFYIQLDIEVWLWLTIEHLDFICRVHKISAPRIRTYPQKILDSWHQEKQHSNNKPILKHTLWDHEFWAPSSRPSCGYGSTLGCRFGGVCMKLSNCRATYFDPCLRFMCVPVGILLMIILHFTQQDEYYYHFHFYTSSKYVSMLVCHKKQQLYL